MVELFALEKGLLAKRDKSKRELLSQQVPISEILAC
jgi:hypothetical protein